MVGVEVAPGDVALDADLLAHHRTGTVAADHVVGFDRLRTRAILRDGDTCALRILFDAAVADLAAEIRWRLRRLAASNSGRAVPTVVAASANRPNTNGNSRP